MWGDSGRNNRTAFAYNGPSEPVQKVATNVLTEGQILPLVCMSIVNASWTQDFWSPALRCDDVQDDERDGIWVSIWNSYKPEHRTDGSIQRSVGLPYLSWAPWSPTDDNDTDLANSSLPFRGSSLSSDPLAMARPGESLSRPCPTCLCSLALRYVTVETLHISQRQSLDIGLPVTTPPYPEPKTSKQRRIAHA